MPSLLQMSFAIFFSIVVKNTNIETIDPKIFCLFTQYPIKQEEWCEERPVPLVVLCCDCEWKPGKNLLLHCTRLGAV